MTVLETLPDTQDAKLTEVFTVRLTSEEMAIVREARDLVKRANKSLGKQVRKDVVTLARKIVKEAAKK